MSQDLESMNVDQLREAAKAAGVSTSGNRAQLIARITKATKQTNDEPAPTDTNPEPDAAQDAEGDVKATEGDKKDDDAGAADAAGGSTPLGDAAPKTPAVQVEPAPKAATRVRYKPHSEQTLNLAGLIVPGAGVTFDAPNSEYEAFVPYFLERTDVE